MAPKRAMGSPLSASSSPYEEDGSSTEQELSDAVDDNQHGTAKEQEHDDSGADSEEILPPSPSPSAFRVKLISPRPKPEPTSTRKRGSGLWSEEDEIAILKGMSQYQAEKNVDPCAYMDSFHEFIKRSLYAEASKNQLLDKIRRLKKKYQTNLASKNDLSKPHDLKTFELSEKIWGGSGNEKKNSGKTVNNNNNGPGITLGLAKMEKEELVSMRRPKRAVESGGGGGGDGSVNEVDGVIVKRPKRALESGGGNGDGGVNEVDGVIVKRPKRAVESGGGGGDGGVDEVDGVIVRRPKRAVESGSGDAGVDEVDGMMRLDKVMEMGGFSEGVKEVMREKIGVIGKGKVKELERKWRRLKQAELELFVRKTDLVCEQARVALNAIMSSE